MSVNKISNTEQSQNSNIPENAPNKKLNNDFKNLLSEFIEESNNFPRTASLRNKKLETILNHENYSSFNKLKINHLNDGNKKSGQILNALNSNNIDRQEKLKQVKERLAEGFYQRDDVIRETAGKILDTFGV